MTNEMLEEIRDALLPEHKGESISIPMTEDDLAKYTFTTSAGNTVTANLPQFTTARGGIRFTTTDTTPKWIGYPANS